MNVFIIGLGLIGGSMALDIQKKYPNATLYGVDTNAAHVAEAIELQIVHKKANLEDVEHADMVIISVPVDASLKVIKEVLDHINDETLVFDVGSTKQKICAAIQEHPRRRNFLASHPIAGTEFSGPKAAIEDLFIGKTNIICEVEETAFKLQEKALKLFTELGMRIRYMNPKAHDKHIAYVSHLSHISSFMLGKTVIEKEKNERDIFNMAGSGFASTVRLAKSSPAMWTPIFQQNKENVIEALDEYIENLTAFKKLIEANRNTEIFDVMKNTNRIKEILKGIN